MIFWGTRLEHKLQQRLVGVFVVVVFILLIAPVLLDADGRIPEKITNIPPQPKQPDLSHIPQVNEPIAPLPALPTVEQTEFTIKAQAEADAKAPDSAVGTNLWAVQVASFRDSKKATSLRDRLRKASYKVYVREKVLSDDSLFTQVFVGPVNSKADAQTLKARIKSQIGEQGLLVRYRDP